MRWFSDFCFELAGIAVKIHFQKTIHCINFFFFSQPHKCGHIPLLLTVLLLLLVLWHGIGEFADKDLRYFLLSGG